MVPGQLQPQSLLDQRLTEGSRNSELQSPKPLATLVKTWIQILSGEILCSLALADTKQCLPQPLPLELPEG